MLTTSISEPRPGHVRFAIELGGVSVASFRFPLIYPLTFEEILAGRNCREQDDEGFFITLKDGIITIEIDPRENITIDGYVVFKLPLEVCRDSFVALHPIMTRLWPHS